MVEYVINGKDEYIIEEAGKAWDFYNTMKDKCYVGSIAISAMNEDTMMWYVLDSQS
jgi:hypothetical protein